jgi:hypothetical protein
MMIDLPLDASLAQRYVAGSTTAAETMRVERAMDSSASWRGLVGAQVPAERLEHNLAGVVAELDAPKRGFVERSMIRVGLHDHVARLLAATPVMRRSWYIASVLVLFFGLAASNPDNTNGSLGIFLAIAPLVPVLGVAVAYGPGIDPAHDMTVATPLSGFRLLLIRAVAVLATSVVFGGIGGVLIAQSHGIRVVAWMLPALALTTATLALSTAVATRTASAITAGGWLIGVAVVARAADDFTMFGAPAQPAYAAAALAAGIVLFIRRDAFESVEVAS